MESLCFSFAETFPLRFEWVLEGPWDRARSTWTVPKSSKQHAAPPQRISQLCPHRARDPSPPSARARGPRPRRAPPPASSVALRVSVADLPAFASHHPPRARWLPAWSAGRSPHGPREHAHPPRPSSAAGCNPQAVSAQGPARALVCSRARSSEFAWRRSKTRARCEPLTPGVGCTAGQGFPDRRLTLRPFHRTWGSGSAGLVASQPVGIATRMLVFARSVDDESTRTDDVR
jgi:hypothetical protein